MSKLEGVFYFCFGMLIIFVPINIVFWIWTGHEIFENVFWTQVVVIVSVILFGAIIRR